MSAPEYLADPAASYARSIAVGDVSGDGRDDLVFTSLRTAVKPEDERMEIYVAEQGIDGHLNPAIKVAETNHPLSYQLLLADLDRDGRKDIITVVVNGVALLRANENGTFTATTVAVNWPYDLLVTDVDRDGNPDVLVDSSNTSATVLHGDGHGGVDHTSTLPLPSSALRDLGDVTGDGLDDLILATIFNRPLQEFHVYPALANGGYAAPIVMSLPIYENMPSSIAVGDFNADGRSDLAMDEGQDNGKIHLFLQNAQGNLVQSADILRFRGGGNVLATDLNRDGRTDLAFAHSGWGYMGYYLQTSTGLQSETIVHANQYHGRKNYFAAGDLNHDGCGDLVVSRWTQSPVFVYGKGCASQALSNGPSAPRRSPGTAAQASPPASVPAR